MIEFNEMLYRRLSKVLRFTGKAVRSLGLVFNQSLCCRLASRPIRQYRGVSEAKSLHTQGR